MVWIVVRFVYVHFCCEFVDEFLCGHDFSALEVVGVCEVDCVTIWKRLVIVVEFSYSIWEFAARRVALFYFYGDDATVCEDWVRILTALVSTDKDAVLGELFAYEVVHDAYAIKCLGKEVFFSHG